MRIIIAKQKWHFENNFEGETEALTKFQVQPLLSFKNEQKANSSNSK